MLFSITVLLSIMDSPLTTPPTPATSATIYSFSYPSSNPGLCVSVQAQFLAGMTSVDILLLLYITFLSRTNEEYYLALIVG